MIKELIRKEIETKLQCDFDSEWRVAIGEDNIIKVSLADSEEMVFTILYNEEEDVHYISGDNIPADVLFQILKILDY